MVGKTQRGMLLDEQLPSLLLRSIVLTLGFSSDPTCLWKRKQCTHLSVMLPFLKYWPLLPWLNVSEPGVRGRGILRNAREPDGLPGRVTHHLPMAG